MKLKDLHAVVLTAIAIVGLAIPAAEAAIIDNSQPPTAVLCSGACGVGSSVAFSRTVTQVSPDDATTFTDVWNITLSEAGNIKGILFGNNTLDAFTVTNLNTVLDDGGTPVDPSAGFTVPNPPPFNSVLQTAVTFANLSAGDYQFMVTGFVPNDQKGGQYQFQGKISEVPLPAAIWLLLSAVLGFASVSRLRRAPEAT
jgi:hypothetical protein